MREVESVGRRVENMSLLHSLQRVALSDLLIATKDMKCVAGSIAGNTYTPLASLVASSGAAPSSVMRTTTPASGGTICPLTTRPSAAATGFSGS